MSKNKLTGLLALLLVALLAVAGLLYSRLSDGYTPNAPAGSASSETAESSPLVPAPDFTVYTADGDEVTLSEQLGKPVVLNFWASWCGPCKNEMPHFEEAAARLEGEVTFMMINVTDGDRETVETASTFIADKGYTFPVYYDTELQAPRLYGASSLPLTFFVDAEGHAVTYAVGSLDAQLLQTGIDMICPAE